MAAVLITETWLKQGKNFEKIYEDIRMNKGLELIAYNRPGKRRGGGVAIAFNPSKLKLKENKFRRERIEMVSAVGKIIGDTRPVVLFCIYLPPNLKIDRVRRANELINTELTRIKTELAITRSVTYKLILDTS